jgi:hypothetical protein
MKLGRCPICHSHLHLDQLVQDECGRQLLGLISKLSYRMGPTLVAYIGLFRPAKQDLSNSRAYALAQETLELTTNHPLLAEAMRETVHSIQAKRHQGENKPMANHNYLKRVLEAKAQTAVVNQSPNIEVKHQHQLSEAEDRRLFEERMQQLGGRVMTKVNP